jgi:hypothetical protein
MKTPKWICRTAVDRKNLEIWTNQQLDLMEEKEVRKAAANVNAAVPFVNSMAIDAAIRREDIEALVRLGSDLHARREMLMKLLARRGRGRPKASRTERSAIEAASEQVDWVRQIWKRHYAKQNRAKDNAPQAIDIVVRRLSAIGVHVSAAKLEEHRRKHGRFSTRYSPNKGGSNRRRARI